MNILLYGTEGCHLCDQAKDILAGTGTHFTYIDIADGEALYSRYGMRIPVIARSDGKELDWPFDHEKLNRFLE